MKTMLIVHPASAVLLLTFLGGPALANDQLARSVGAEPGQYTTSQLIRMKSAAGDDEHPVGAVVREDADFGRLSTISVGHTAGHVQLATTLGVDPGEHTTPELIRLRNAAEDDDGNGAPFVGQTVASRSAQNDGMSSGHRQIASSLGVDPNQYSTAELIQMRSDRWSDDEN